ncbi:hypothetical protein E2C01_022023 [Portunus trituberculatus]|uniref:Uncharacterized protein n=1 Tax=Portunus trituberculatus TaxID=210409 RepID=A0A5B7E447_PORTR|nr:hypothetical protein [Portunus trituberculatus]
MPYVFRFAYPSCAEMFPVECNRRKMACKTVGGVGKVTQYSRNSKVLHRANASYETGEQGGTAGQDICNYYFLKLAGTGSPEDQTILTQVQESWVDAESGDQPAASNRPRGEESEARLLAGGTD